MNIFYILLMIIVLNVIMALLMACMIYIKKNILSKIATYSVATVWVLVFGYVCYLLVKLRG